MFVFQLFVHLNSHTVYSFKCLTDFPFSFCWKPIFHDVHLPRVIIDFVVKGHEAHSSTFPLKSIWTFFFFPQAAKLRSDVVAMKCDRELTKALEINGKKMWSLSTSEQLTAVLFLLLSLFPCFFCLFLIHFLTLGLLTTATFSPSPKTWCISSVRNVPLCV